MAIGDKQSTYQGDKAELVNLTQNLDTSGNAKINTTTSGAGALTGKEGYVLIAGDVTLPDLAAGEHGYVLTVKRKTAKGTNTLTAESSDSIDHAYQVITFGSREYITLIWGPGGASGAASNWNIISGSYTSAA